VSRPLLQRPIGFLPSEISSLVNEAVVSRHAEEAAFLWMLRNRAVDEPHYSLEDLATLDQRVEAHLDGLRIAGDVGWRFCKQNHANEGPGEVFALSVMAFGVGDRERMLEALNAGCASPRTRPGLVSALGWLDYAIVSPWISRLLEAKSPLHRSIGVAASAIHRQDPGSALTAAVTDPDPVLRARALRAAGELKRSDLLNQLRDHLSDEDGACRFWAAWSLTVNGERSGLRVLTDWFERDDAFTQHALHISLRALDLDQSRQWISSMSKEPKQARWAVMGAGIVGDPATIPWLIRRMESPELGRLAGEAFTMITGVDLTYHDLDQDPPGSDQTDEASIEDVVDLNYESNLPWPSPLLVGQWWEKNGHAFSAGTRYLDGKALSSQSAFEVLVRGKQRQRAAAALELALINPDRMLFEVRARGNRQQRELAAWTS
jgi:uncharacterized protein (TIGR02270 family)